MGISSWFDRKAVACDLNMLYFSNMDRNIRHDLIKHIQATLPRGAPFDLATLGDLGVSPRLAAYYAKAGWLQRLGQGVYAFPADDFDVYGALLFLQKQAPNLHVGGKSALSLYGVRHNLMGRDTWVLWGDRRLLLPAWFKSRFPSRYVHAQLFDWPDGDLNSQTLATPPAVLDGVQVSVPERAVMEMLHDVGTKQSMEEARNLFDGLRSPRKDVIGQLLSCCTSVKAVRLFLTWSRETDLLDVDALLDSYRVRSGSTSRWMSRLDDGTLLSLKPRG